jgi:radical SAM superfamily enzyme YgiQ (UPF0313 family)
MSHQSMKDVADFIKEYNRKLPVIVGGVHPSSVPDFVLNDCESIDFVSLYEGDSSFITFLDCINGKTPENKLSQIATKDENTYLIIDNRKMEEDIASAPEFGDLAISDYHHFGKIGAYHYLLSDEVKASTVLSSRGCRGNCTFCSVKAFYGGNGVRQRDITTVVDEMESLHKKYNIRHFMWLDDDLLFNEKRAINLFKEIARRRLNITWDASNGVVARSITPEIALAAYESGCIGLTIGIESGNPEILHSIRKPSRIKHFKRAAEILQEYPDIFTKGFLMVGFLNETLGQILDTIRLARELSLDWYPIQILTPFPATGVRKVLEEEGIIEANDIASRFFVGSTGGQRLREKQEKTEAKEFYNPFERTLNKIPTREELKDIWFIMDYKVNYEKILLEECSVKLKLLQKMLRDVCHRVPENPLANLYLGIVEGKLGNYSESQRLKHVAETYLEGSAFWRKRFEALDLYRLV